MSEIIETSQNQNKLTQISLQPLLHEEDNADMLLAPPKPRRRGWMIALIIVLLAALIGGGAFFYVQRNSQSPVQYTQQAVNYGNISVTVSASGPINPRAEYDMNFTASGQVKEIDVHVGQQVKAGQVLAKLNSPSLEDALAQAQQNVSNAQVVYNDAVNNGSSQTVLDNDNNQLLSAEAQLKTAQDNLAATVLTAPASATVAAINGNLLETVGANSSGSSSLPFIALTDISSLTIAAQVNEADIGNVQVGQSAKFTVAAYPSLTFRATVATVSIIGLASSNVVNYAVNLTVDQHSLGNTHIYPGMTATVNITTAQRIGALLVSNSAFSFTTTALSAGVIDRSALAGTLGGFSATRSSQGNQRIVLELQNGKLIPVLVTVGLTNGTFTEVLSGLQSGDQVVVGATGGSFSNLSGTGGNGNGARPGGGLRIQGGLGG
jgi:HlyD family secretion protein